jgi:GNAT superfamily N-acetyltransferase
MKLRFVRCPSGTPAQERRLSPPYDRGRERAVVSAARLSHPRGRAREGDEPVTLARLYSDRDGQRAGALMAATRRDLRGRGLATLAKVESERRAASLGITRILTSNDLDNAPMLAINGKLGFVPAAAAESFTKTLIV